MRLAGNVMRKHLALALLTGALAFLFSCASAFGQRPLPPQQGEPPALPTPTPKPTPPPDDDKLFEVVRVSSNLVVVPVSVTDSSGHPVQGLKTTDFRLEEEGRTQQIAEIGDPEQVPLDIAVLLDVSASIEARFGFEQQTAANFLKRVLKPGDRATVFAIDETPRFIQALSTAEVAAQKLTAITPTKGYTAFFDTVIQAARYLEQNSSPQHRRVIIVISDGDDTARILDA